MVPKAGLRDVLGGHETRKNDEKRGDLADDHIKTNKHRGTRAKAPWTIEATRVFVGVGGVAQRGCETETGAPGRSEQVHRKRQERVFE